MSVLVAQASFSLAKTLAEVVLDTSKQQSKGLVSVKLGEGMRKWCRFGINIIIRVACYIAGSSQGTGGSILQAPTLQE